MRIWDSIAEIALVRTQVSDGEEMTIPHTIDLRKK